MDIGGTLLLSLIFLVNSVGGRDVLPEYQSAPPLNRGSFPAGFLFGTSSSAYQYEGAAHEGGRGTSIWDTFTKKYPEKIDDRSSGVVAEDFYHRYKEDVGLMKDIGFNAHRFSISWSRLLPRGNITGGVNPEGVKFYNNLINELLSKGLQPFVSIFHWDLPQVLEDDYGGFLHPRIVTDFRDYAELCYKEFGDRVKHWITFNEPHMFSVMGYANGVLAPGRCSKWYSLNCTGGDSATEPYLVAHHQLLAHAAAVKVYKDKYQVSQKGQIGISLDCDWHLPYHHSEDDNAATDRAIAFSFGWFIEPLKSGSYPREMVNNVQQRLPKFSKEQSLMVKGSFDFIGLNYYTSSYAANALCSSVNISYLTDSCVILSDERNGVPIGPKAVPDWLYVYPKGIQDLLIYTKKKLKNPPIYITENGVGEFNTGKVSLEDNMRINYHHHHLSFVQSAIRNGVDVRGYFIWSLLDNFQWSNGYTVRFGIVYVDFKNGLKRYPKSSAKWFKKFLHSYNQTVLKEVYICNNVTCTELLLST